MIKSDPAPSGYRITHVHRDNPEQTRGGGLAVIHRDTITAQPRKHKLTHSSFELQIVNIGLKSRDIVLANIYRPPSSSKPLFFEEFGLLLTNLGTDAVDRLLICGDFNLPGTSPDKIDSGLAELLESTSFTQFVNSPTRHDSHHLSISRPTLTYCWRLRWSNGVRYNIRPWQGCSSEKPVVVWAQKSEKLAFTRRHEAKKRRRRLERRWKASNAESDRLAYRAACSTTNKLIAHSRAASNLKCINEASSHPKRLWGTIKSLLHSSPPSEQLSPSVSQPLANSLASFFLQKILTLKNSISSKLHGSPPPFDFDQPHQDELLFNITSVTPTEVTQLLHSMSNKSSPLDYVPTSLLKSCADTFSIIISHLANLSFKEGTFPSKFKLALVSPLLKKPGLPKSDLANFRPISNLNTIAKSWNALPLHAFSPHFNISQFRSVTIRLPQVSFHWDCFAQAHEWYHGKHRLWKDHNSHCSWHVSCLRYSRSYNTSTPTSIHFWLVWLCPNLDSLILNKSLIFC